MDSHIPEIGKTYLLLWFYLDDILVTVKTDEEHLVNLEKVLQWMETHGLRLNKSKCTCMAPEVVYLGHKIDKNGLHQTEDKVRAIRDASQPTNVSELRTYLGLHLLLLQH